MLERFALPSANHHLLESLQFFRGQDALEVQVKLHSWQLQDLCQQELHLESGRLHAFPGEEFTALLNDFQYRHVGNLETNSEL